MEGPAGQRSLQGWWKGRCPRSLESSGVRVTETDLALSTSAHGPLLKAGLSTSPALPPAEERLQAFLIVFCSLPTRWMCVTCLTNQVTETQWQEKKFCHKSRTKTDKWLLLVLPIGLSCGNPPVLPEPPGTSPSIPLHLCHCVFSKHKVN